MAPPFSLWPSCAASPAVGLLLILSSVFVALAAFGPGDVASTALTAVASTVVAGGTLGAYCVGRQLWDDAVARECMSSFAVRHGYLWLRGLGCVLAQAGALTNVLASKVHARFAQRRAHAIQAEENERQSEDALEAEKHVGTFDTTKQD